MQAQHKLDEQEAELAALRVEVARLQAERTDNVRAAQELKAALKQYLEHNDSAGVEKRPEQRAAVEDNWGDLQQRVLGMHESVMSGKKATPRSRLSSTQLYSPHARQDGSKDVQQDPVGAVGELVAAVARERQAR